MDTPQKTPNTIRGRFVSIVNGVYTIKSNKCHFCHIPKALRHLRLKKGDFVFVKNKGSMLLLVDKVFREDIEVTGKTYRPVLSKVKKSQKIALGEVERKRK